MWSRHASYKQAYRTLHEALPLFNATESFTKLLELYAVCNCSPSFDHPAVRSWLGAGYQHHITISVQPPSSATVPSLPTSPTRRAPGTALVAPLPKQWTKSGNQPGHSLSSLRPVKLDG
ncbi:hypothetical protein EI94DRAFT_1656611 [Lactarius quietus]|nr:hypothetical protein EI94DRAFT_1656611 [Lactarius quietus]